MTHSLTQLAPGAYDLLSNGDILGSVVRNSSHHPYTWTDDLLEDLPSNQRPAPFTKIEHAFTCPEDLCAWLSDPDVKTNNPHGNAWEG
jgi:hypothetical protein